MTEPEKLQPEPIVYLRFLFGLFIPGKAVSVYNVHPTEPSHVHDWSEDELSLLIEEGRRQLDRQENELERVRARAQFLLATGLGLLGLILAGARAVIAADTLWLFLVWSVSIVGAVLGLLGSIALVVARKELRNIDAALLTTTERPLLPELAAAYARCARTGANTIATHVTVYRDAVFLVIVGAACYAAVWPFAAF